MNVQRHFHSVKSVFFPRWDRDDRWRVTTSSKRNVDGYCDSKRRVIEIVRTSSDHPDKLDLLLIHEICHAFSSGHGKMWQDRMSKAIKRAHEVGRHELAQLLQDEILGYQRSPSASLQRELFYGSIEDAVLGRPKTTLPAIISYLADKNGMLESEVCKSYPRTEAVFRKAKHDAEKVWGPTNH